MLPPHHRRLWASVLTNAAVDQVVRSFWVNGVLRQHAPEDPTARWSAFLTSESSAHLPTATWPSVAWIKERVPSALHSMHDNAAPGVTGAFLADWKAMPLW